RRAVDSASWRTGCVARQPWTRAVRDDDASPAGTCGGTRRGKPVMKALEIREIETEEFAPLGRLMVDVYSRLEGFPSPDEQPGYYEMLANIGRFTASKDAEVLIAFSPNDELVGGVVYFGDMSEYGSVGTATTVTNASGLRLLAVDPRFRGMGAGKALTDACIALAREKGHAQVVLHTTQAMKVAWGMYEKLGFVRSTDLDFLQENLPVFGFRLTLDGMAEKNSFD